MEIQPNEPSAPLAPVPIPGPVPVLPGPGPGPGPVLPGPEPVQTENNYIEADFRTVELCKEFMRDYTNFSKTHLYNPFSGRRIKRGTGTFVSVHLSVKKYLQSLDDEEFHSPIKNVQVLCKNVSNNLDRPIDDLDFEILDDKINREWIPKAKINYKALVQKQEREEKAAAEKDLFQWRNDLILDANENFALKLSEWKLRSPELYSFLDTFKPEIFENKFMMHHVFLYDEQPNYFILYLQNSARLFLNKDYGYSIHRPVTEKRYAPAMVMFWIYANFISNARKYLKRNSKKLSDYLSSKPSNLLRITKNNLNSLAIAHFIHNTPPDCLCLFSAKDDYEKHFDQQMTSFFEWANRESVYAKIYYRSQFLDFMASRVKGYRYISIHYEDFDRFDDIIQYVSNPIFVHEEEEEQEES